MTGPGSSRRRKGRQDVPGDQSMFRMRISRFRDRGSYKSSEVVGLFIISIFIGMVFSGLCMLVDFIIGQFFRTGGTGTG